MPFARKMRYALFGALLVLLVIIYVTTGPAATRNSEFYKKTVALMEYRNKGGGGGEDEKKFPDRPLHRAGGLHYAEGDKHLTPEERLAMEQGKLKGEPPVGPDGEAIMGPVPQSNQQGQRPVIDTDAKLKERLREAENAAKKSADEKYRALKDIEDEVEKDHEQHGDPQQAVSSTSEKKKQKTAGKDSYKYQEENDEDQKSGESGRVNADDNDSGDGEVDKEPKKKKPPPGEKGIAGRKKIPAEEAPAYKVQKPLKGKKKPEHVNEDTDEEDDREQTRLRSLLAEILSKSPVTIFSKTYCPFSKRAKYILLEANTIVPAPYVVELDQHPDGPAMQQLLVKTTGRKTVPNVLVNGKSIGGGDETSLLWRNGELPARIQQMAGKRVDSVKVNFEYGKEPEQ